MNYKDIILKKIDNKICYLSLNRPQVLNALNINTFNELDNAIDKINKDTSINVIIITGKGDRAFSSGADINEMLTFNTKSDSEKLDKLRQQFYLKLMKCNKPTIGMINGIAYGGGAILASCLDIRIGSENAKFQFSASKHGKLHGTWSLPLQIGWPLSKELLFSAREIKSKEAYRIGLLNHLVSNRNLKNKSIELANQISNNYPEIVQKMKKIMIENIGYQLTQMSNNEINLRKQLDYVPIEKGFKTFINKKNN